MFEGFSERWIAGRADIQGAAGVMFAEAGQGADAEDFFNGEAGGEFAGDDLFLMIEAAKGGDDAEDHTIAFGSEAQSGPLGSGDAFHLLFAPEQVEADGDEVRAFIMGRETVMSQERSGKTQLDESLSDASLIV